MCLLAKIFELLKIRNTLVIIIACSMLAYLFSISGEHILHKIPCDLCLITRYIYLSICLLSMYGLYYKIHNKYLLWLATLFIIPNFGYWPLITLLYNDNLVKKQFYIFGGLVFCIAILNFVFSSHITLTQIIFQCFIIVVTAILLLFDNHHNKSMLCLLLIIMLCAFGFASYHLGVENHWWKGPAGCTVDLLPTLNDDVVNTSQVRCDVVNWEIFGLSSTLYNFALMGFLNWLFSLSFMLELLKRREED